LRMNILEVLNLCIRCVFRQWFRFDVMW
jgi:hypothetical protein